MQDFTFASTSMIAGRKLRRSSWPQGTFCTVEKRGRKRFAFVYSTKHPHGEPHVFYWDDVSANDWELAV